MTNEQRLERQLRFSLEADALKRVLRQTRTTGERRRENSAEHSWHLALLAVLLAEHAAPEVDVGRVIRMVLVHDIVEVDAGDTFAYDAAGNLDRAEREQRAAARLFGLLPEGQAGELRALWEEFEAGESPDARFAAALDRLQPLLQNAHTDGGTWKEHGLTRAQVLQRMRPIEHALPAAWPTVLRILDDAIAAGQLRP